MNVKTFIIEGKYKVKTKTGEKLEKFKMKVKGTSEDATLEKVYSSLGSHHRVKRNVIKIEKVKESGE